MADHSDSTMESHPNVFSRFWKWLSLGSGRPSSPGAQTDWLVTLEAKIHYHFQDPGLLANAMLHRSQVHVSGRSREESNERLEFLGDAVLGAVVSDHLYHVFPDRSEGDLTKMKSLLVCGARLAEVAKANNLGQFIRMSRSEASAGGRLRPTILADATEALLGAIYLDGGFREAEKVIHHFILADSQEILNRRSLLNFKSRLQERVQAEHRKPPRYRVVGSAGPDHDRTFEVEVSLAGNVLGRGRGPSKKVAEQKAAQEALARLDLKT